jgi:PPK2 family polyphosphate:nucleotide phosphotransferase
MPTPLSRAVASCQEVNVRIDTKTFAVRKGERVRLGSRPTAIKPLYSSKEDYERLLSERVVRLSDLQRMLYAANSHALLVVFQAMDAAGKDSAIRHVMSGVNPQGCQVYSFKHPSASELSHDFLWRTTLCLPERGRIGIFNRSYYEEVLIVRVHPKILLSEGIPGSEADSKRIWQDRYDSIVDLEAHLHRNGTRIVKFFLHVSKEEQRKRFLARIDEPSKNWKFNLADVEERRFWPQYMDAYEQCLSETSRRYAPWYVVPADDKRNTRLMVSQVLIETLESLDLGYPKVGAARLRELEVIRKQLIEAK